MELKSLTSEPLAHRAELGREDVSTRLIANERLVDAVRRLELDGIVFKELETR